MTRKRLHVSALLAMAIVASTSMLSRPAQAVPWCGGVQDTCSCGGANFCICCSDGAHGTNHGNCVWWAWHMACCNWGRALEWCTNANTFDNYASSNGYPVRTQPCAGTIFVCESNTSYCYSGSVGHVGWVTAAYPNGSIDVTEQGCQSFYGVHSRHFNAQSASPTMHYIYRPGSGGSCGSCACNAGQTETQACGNCGTRSRTCNSNCQWGSWSACSGQGACSPGSVQEQSCCDCGTQRRTCSSACAWSSFSACAGPDPSNGTETCDTGESGPCAPGLVRCIEGCRTCRRTYEPQPETCDDVDNDCNGEVDDGDPSQMGDPPPAMAARLIDVGYPNSVIAGSWSEGWAVFRNEGSRTWEKGELWLEATTTWRNEASPLQDLESWPAYGVAAVLDRSVAPGENVRMVLSLKVADDAAGPVRETFHLVDREGGVLRCPAVHFDVSLMARSGGEVEAAADAGISSSRDEVGTDSGCSQRGTVHGSNSRTWLLLLLGGVLFRKRVRAQGLSTV